MSSTTHHAPPPVSILHLSDLHLGPETATEEVAKVRVEGFESQSLAREVLTWLRDSARVPDYVVVSGDISNQNGAEGYAAFLRAYESLVAAKKAPDPTRIIVVPGNHDVQRPKDWHDITPVDEWDTPPRERWAHFLGAVGDRFVRPWMPTTDADVSALIDLIRGRFTGADETVGGGFEVARKDGVSGRQALPFVFHRSHKTVFYAFNSASVSGTLLAASPELQEDVRWILGDKSANADRAQRVVKELFDRSRVDPARVQPRELELFRRTMELLREIFRDEFDEALKVAVLHHHVAPIFQEEVQPFDLILNAARFKAELSAFGFRLVLHGHKHDPRVFVDSALSGPPVAVVSGATIGGVPAVGRSPGFHWIDLPEDRREIVVRSITVPSPGGFNAAWDQAVQTRVPLLPDVKTLNEIVSVGDPRVVSVRRLHARTHDALVGRLGEEHLSTGEKLLGWSHDLDRVGHVTMIATAMGLCLAHQLGCDRRSFAVDAALESLLKLRVDGVLWSATTETSPDGRPEATAWALLALHAWGLVDEVTAGVEAFVKAFSPENDPALWNHTTSLSLVIRTLARIAPEVDMLGHATATLVEGAMVEDGALYWTQRLGIPDKEPSVAHTAGALVALIEAHEVLGTASPIGSPAFSATSEWIINQPAWLPTAETISRPVGPTKWDNLFWRHFTRAKAITAVAMAGVDGRNLDRLRFEVAELVDSEEDGLWRWGPQFPIWATHDAVEAIRAAALDGFTL